MSHARCRLTHVLVLAGAAGAAFAGPPSFIGLGDVAPGDISSSAHAISADGLVVTGRCTPAGSQNVFRWTAAGGIVGLGGPNLAQGSGCSADGSVIVGYNSTFAGTVQAFRWTLASGFQSFTGVSAGSPGPRALAVSANGAIAVGDSNLGIHATAVRWIAPGAATALSNEPAFIDSTAVGVNADGTVIVGGGSNVVGLRAFRWTPSGGMVALPDLDGGTISATANAVSADGSILAGFGTSAEGQQACLWINSSPVGLGDLPGGTFESTALAMSADGKVVVGYGNTGNGQEAFVWDNINGMRNLRGVLATLNVSAVAGWTLTQATGVSGDGTVVVGFGTDPGGFPEAWVAHLPAPVSCYANCDNSTSPPVLNIQDFACFQTQFVAGSAWANCDNSTVAPELNVLDFTCFLNKFAIGCP